jgi:hypothetical protein
MTTGEEYEAALRSLPEAHSLALRLRDAGAADEVVCEYLHIERESLSALIDVAFRKLGSALHTCREQAGNGTYFLAVAIAARACRPDAGRPFSF